MPAMQDIPPSPPQNLNPLCRELLEAFNGHEKAAEIVLGGGVALSHYLEFRDTVDLDAWWRTEPRSDVLEFVEDCMKSLAAKHNVDYRRRSWGETESLELVRDSQKLFSFQISRRTRFLDPVIPAHWRPLWIETLRDNAASKMTALVQRGAPRDFIDIYEICRRGLLSADDCWGLWKQKNPDIPKAEAARKIVARLAIVELTRPLESIQPESAREKARLVRAWYRDIFTR